MAKVLKLTGRVKVRVNKKATYIGAGSDVTEIAKADMNKYGLKEKDIDRIVNSGCGFIHDDDAVPMPRINVLVEAIHALDRENEDEFTESGVPEVAVLKELTESQVTAVERDQAWEEYQRRYPEAAE